MRLRCWEPHQPKAKGEQQRGCVQHILIRMGRVKNAFALSDQLAPRIGVALLIGATRPMAG